MRLPSKASSLFSRWAVAVVEDLRTRAPRDGRLASRSAAWMRLFLNSKNAPSRASPGPAGPR